MAIATFSDIVAALANDDPEAEAVLLGEGLACRRAQVGPTVFFRGLIEFSNVCRKDCHYCGIRRSNRRVQRYTMDPEAIADDAALAFEQQYGSIVLQSGERTDRVFVDFVEDVLLRIHRRTSGLLGVTLSLGEQSVDTYRRWFEAGAHRYLLRIETSQEALYRSIHPSDHRFQNRLDSLDRLRSIGYQVGTGVMIGIPGQTVEDLARDVLFFEAQDIDMLGMGPFIVHQDTPMADAEDSEALRAWRFHLALRMVAVCRLYLKDVNIAASTAMQALHPQGREMALQAGANIIMPNVTRVGYREHYQLYDNKPCLTESPGDCRDCIRARIRSVGDEPGDLSWGDSPHYARRVLDPLLARDVSPGRVSEPDDA